MERSLPGGWYLLAAFGLVLLVLALSACDERRAARLEEGVSTEADVRREFGAPFSIEDQPDGSRVFEYPRQPEGQTNYFITIGPDGRMASLRQVLKEADFRKVVPGLEQTQVRRLLGMPARTQRYELRREEVWEWRYLQGQTPKVFEVRFDAEGRVIGSASADDPRATQPGG